MVKVFWCPDSGEYAGAYQYVTQSPLLTDNSWTVTLPRVKVGNDLKDIAGQICWIVSVVSGGNEVSTSDQWVYYHDQLGGKPQPACP